MRRVPLPLAALLGVVAGAAGAAVGGQSPGAMALTAGFVGVLSAVSLVDLRERRIPNVWTYPAMAVALLAAVAAGSGAALLALGGFAACGAYMGLFHTLGGGRLGMGDVKLSALAGLVVGIAGAPLFLLLGTAAGAASAGWLLARGAGRGTAFPYGPSLAIGAAATVLLRGPAIS